MFLDENRDDLNREAASYRATAQQMLRESKDLEQGFPMSNASWLAWLDANDQEFRSQLRDASDMRRNVGLRLQPREGGLPPAPRVGLRAGATQGAPTWALKVQQHKEGWFCIESQAETCVFFAASLSRQGLSLPLRLVQGPVFALDLANPLLDPFQPLQKMVAAHLGPLSK